MSECSAVGGDIKAVVKLAMVGGFEGRQRGYVAAVGLRPQGRQVDYQQLVAVVQVIVEMADLSGCCLFPK